MFHGGTLHAIYERKNDRFSRHAIPQHKKEVSPSALNERQKNPEMAAFPGFFLYRGTGCLKKKQL